MAYPGLQSFNKIKRNCPILLITKGIMNYKIKLFQLVNIFH